MNNQSKAQFEAAVKEKFGHSIEHLTAVDETGEAKLLVNAMAWAWQASREVLVVELPGIPTYEEGNSYIQETLDQCRLAIVSAGIRARP